MFSKYINNQVLFSIAKKKKRGRHLSRQVSAPMQKHVRTQKYANGRVLRWTPVPPAGKLLPCACAHPVAMLGGALPWIVSEPFAIWDIVFHSRRFGDVLRLCAVGFPHRDPHPPRASRCIPRRDPRRPSILFPRQAAGRLHSPLRAFAHCQVCAEILGSAHVCASNCVCAILCGRTKEVNILLRPSILTSGQSSTLNFCFCIACCS